jgi:glycosyltransferase involved in cell wall biosynthesis
MSLLPNFGWNVEVLTCCASGEWAVHEDVRVVGKSVGAWSWSSGMARWLLRNVRNYDLLHVHSLFQFPSVASGLVAHCKTVPFILTPHGTLCDWELRERRPYLKRLCLYSIDGYLIRAARFLHFTSERERTEASHHVALPHSVVIPYAVRTVPVHRSEAVRSIERRYPILRGKDIVLFMSRIHRKKGLDILVPAMKRVVDSCPNAALVIAGAVTDGEKAIVRGLVREQGFTGTVLDVGYVKGILKWELLSASAIVALPSLSESFGIIVVEAMACGTPVLLGEGVALSDAVDSGVAGVVVKPEVEAVADATICMLRQPNLWEKYSKAGLEMACRKFAPEMACGGLADLYSRAIGAEHVGAGMGSTGSKLALRAGMGKAL